MPFVSVDGRGLHYEERGEGAPLMLLHGFPLASESFWPQLEAPWPGYRLIAPDHRGFGRSEPGVGVATMEAMALDALALLDALGIPQAIVGGVSMGGYISIALLRHDPGRVRGLLLLDTRSVADDEAGLARRETMARDVERVGAAAAAEAMLPSLLSADVDGTTRARVDALMRAQAPAAIAAASRGMATRTDGEDILSRYGGPCLIVVGERDTITPPATAQLMAELMPQAKVEVIARAGHLANLEQPVAFNACVGRFLRESFPTG